MSVEQRLETLETDLELVTQLLASTASYGESAQRRIDALGGRLDQQTANQERLDRRLDEFIFQAQRLIGNQGEKVDRLEGSYERLEANLAYLTRKQDNHEQMMQTLTQIAVDQAAVLQRQDQQLAELRRIGENHEAELATLRAAVDRLDRLMDYVIRRDQGNQNQSE